jgi:lipoic acid synthetase
VQCGAPEPLDDTEPERLAKCIKRLELKYVVLTSVARDDLADGGSGHIAEIVSTIKDQCPETKVEVLLSDFGEDHGSIRVIVHSKPDVFGHNLETVRRMHKRIKTPPSDYDTSLRVLKFLKENTQLVVKTGIMVGIGEKSEEVCDTLEDVARIGVDICTIGQYMTPSINHYPVQKYYELSEFQEFKRIGEEKGIKCVISGPFVRSSYGANQTFELVCPGENSFFRTTQSY